MPLLLLLGQNGIIGGAANTAQAGGHNSGSGTNTAAPSGYKNAVLALSPAGYWRCNDSGTTTLADLSGNGQTMTLHGTYTEGASSLIFTDPATTSTNFSGNAYGTFASTIVGPSSGTAGIVAWFQSSTTRTMSFDAIATWADVALILENGAITLWPVPSSLGAQAGTAVPCDGHPHMLALIFNYATGAYSYWQDGVQITTGSVAPFTPTASAGGYIGTYFNGSGDLIENANLSDVAFIDGLTGTQIAALYSAANTLPITGTAATAQKVQANSGTGKSVFTGTGSTAQAVQSNTGTGSVSGAVATGTGATAQHVQSNSGSGLLEFIATASSAQHVQTNSGSATVTTTSAGASAQHIQSNTGTGLLIFTSTVATAQKVQANSGTGNESFIGTGATAQAHQANSGSGTNSPSTNAGATAQHVQQNSGTGILIFTGTLASSQNTQANSGSGSVTSLGITGTAATSQGHQANSGAGTVTSKGTAATSQHVQSNTGVGQVITTGIASTSQRVQSNTGSGLLIFTGIEHSTQSVQHNSGTGLVIINASGACNTAQKVQQNSGNAQLIFIGVVHTAQAIQKTSGGNTIVPHQTYLFSTTVTNDLNVLLQVITKITTEATATTTVSL